MWIRMITTAAGPRLPHSLNHGSVYEVEDELGEELVSVRAAERVANPKAQASAPAEVAAVDDGETADDPGAEKKAETLIDKLKGKSAKK